MSKLWLIALYEYKRHVWQKKFILVLFSVPLVIGLMIGLVALINALEERADAVGYVDHAGLLVDPLPAPQRGSSPDSPTAGELLPLVPFDSEEAARAALEAKEIQAYYVITPDYFETNQVEMVYFKAPGGNVSRQFWDFMQINRLRDLPPEVAGRAVARSNLTIRWPDDGPNGGREFSQRTFLNSFVPFFVGMALVFLLFSASGYLMGAVVEEKENQTMEILVTSLSPNQLMTGKVVGILGVTLTQLVGWVVLTLIAVLIGGRYLGIGLLQGLSLDLGMLALSFAIAAPAFVMLAALMTAVGATVAEAQEAQQVTGLFILPFMIPIYLIQPIIENPDSALTLALSLFPPTSVATFSLRLAFSRVPGWQISTSIALTSLCAAGALWLAGRAFRLGMLRYGQRLNLKELFARAPEFTGGKHE